MMDPETILRSLERRCRNPQDRPGVAVPMLLQLLAAVLDQTAEGTPLGLVVEAMLKAVPAGPFSGRDLSRLAEEAGRARTLPLTATCHQAATALREMAMDIEECLVQATSEKGRRAATGSDPIVALKNLAGTFLSRYRCQLVEYLLEQKDYTAPEQDVIAYFWPEDCVRKRPSHAARNRLHKLEYDTNEALAKLSAPTWKIRRNNPLVLTLTMNA